LIQKEESESKKTKGKTKKKKKQETFKHEKHIFMFMSRPVYLGKIDLHWCSNCEVPVIDSVCVCGNETAKTEITPPGDIRPAFKYDIERINKVSKEQFGFELIKPGEFVLLNKAPYEDRMEEIIVVGKIIGIIRFEIEKMKWVLLLKPNGAQRIFYGKNVENDRKLKGWIKLYEGAVSYVLDGTSVLIPGIETVSDDIEAEDEVVVLSPKNTVVATGRAKLSSKNIRTLNRGKAVKVRTKIDLEEFESLENREIKDSNDFFTKEKRIEDVIRANENVINSFEEKAIEFIKNTTENIGKKPTCSYSGGKDSLVTLQLVKKALPDYDILFSDTGLEFDETIQNIKDVSEIYNKKLIETSAGNGFWEQWEIEGPPSLDNRWCNKICKLTPLSNLIEDNFSPDGCLTFIGQRRYESLARAKSERIWKNPNVQYQIGAAPIQDWTAFHVWLYIFKEKLPYNPLYEKGFDRIGCWLCPSASLSDFENLKETHPEKMKFLEQKLREQANKRNIKDVDNYIKFGCWRYNIKKIPVEIKNAIKKENEKKK